MSLYGKIEQRKASWDKDENKIPEAWFVRYETTMSNEPTRVISRWKVTYSQGILKDGQEVSWNGADPWHGYTSALGSIKIWTEKEGENECLPCPCPKVRKGIETRWISGRWEKHLKSGWTPA